MTVRTIGELARDGLLDFGDGYRTKRSEHGHPGYRILRVADVGDGSVTLNSPDFVDNKYEDSIGSKLSEAGDVLLTTKGTVGRVAVMPPGETVVYSPQLCYFRILDPQALSSAYLRYWFKSEDFKQQASHRMNNTDMAAYINLADIRSLALEVQPLAEQRRIAEVLGALDDKIAANQQIRHRSSELVRALYTRATLAATATPLMDVFTVQFGEPFAGSSFTEPGSGRPLIRIRDLKTFRSQIWTDEVRAREIVVRPGDVVVGMDAEFTPTWWESQPGLLNQRVMRVSSDTFGSAFVKEALVQPLKKIESGKTGTTVIHLNKADLARTTMSVPDDSSLLTFRRQADPILTRHIACAAENERLAATRDALLPLLMSGKLRVKDAEDQVGELV